MGKPLAYSPAQGYKYQLLCKMTGERAFEHCDYAKDKKELTYLTNEYRMAYKGGCTFKSVLLPAKYWKE